jgi:hypothetical protein
MSFRPRLYDPGSGGSDLAEITDTPPPPLRAPVPLMRIDVEQRTPDGPAIDATFLWRNADAAACRFCLECNFEPGPEGQGMCTIRVPAPSRPVGLLPQRSTPNHPAFRP